MIQKSSVLPSARPQSLCLANWQSSRSLLPVMLPANPFLQIVLPRAARALQRLEGQIWHAVDAAQVEYAGSQPERMEYAAAKRARFRQVALPFIWGKLFDQGWFRVTLQAGTKGRYLRWMDDGEGTVYHKGVPWCGFDVAHRYCPIPDGAKTLEIETLCLQSAIWHPAASGLHAEGSVLREAAVCVRDEDAWHAYHDLDVLIQLAQVLAGTVPGSPLLNPELIGWRPPMDIIPPVLRRLLRGLDDAVNAFDQYGPAPMRRELAKTYRALAVTENPVRAVLTGHAHIDLVWLWPERSMTFKAVHTFSTMNRLMDEYPEFRFGFTQPPAYEAVQAASPKLMGEVRGRIASGKWEALGAMEVESDSLMPCGEALARSFLVGQRGFTRLQGKPSRVLWIPDVFGYSGCLPAIMKQTGVDYFFTTKLIWSSINRFPYSSFKWQGFDGSEVLAHLTQEMGYNQWAAPGELRKAADAYRQADVHQAILAPTGFGDGGGGVTPEMCERVRRMKSLAGLPAAKWGRVDDFFDTLEGARPQLPAWRGELYLEFHHGVLTTHGELKARYRATERALQTWEAVRCACGGAEIDDAPWKRLIFAQFHDYLPGSSIWEVYEEGLPELQRVADSALESARKELTGRGEDSLFNPLPLPLLHMEKDRAVYLPPLAGGDVSAFPALKLDRPAKAATGAMSSEHVQVRFDTKGRIVRLAFDGCEIPCAPRLGDLVLYPDQPHCFEAWEIDRQTLSLGKPVESKADAEVTLDSGLEAAVSFSKSLGERSKVNVTYRLDAFQPVLHVEYDIDWREEQTLLKALFPTRYSGNLARFGAPFGSAVRGQLPGSPVDEAMFEVPGSRWAAVSDEGERAGLAVIAEAKYGFHCRDGQLGVSLLRAPHVTGEDAMHQRLLPPGLRRGGAREKFSDQGRHIIRLALCAHGVDRPRAQLAPALAETLFATPLMYRGPGVTAGFSEVEGLNTVVPCWAKPAVDGKGWILRLHETMGHRGEIRLDVAADRQVRWTNLSEENPVKKNRLEVGPYQILSAYIAGS